VPRLHRHVARGSLAVAAGLLLVGALGFGPSGPTPPSGGVLGEVQELLDADAAAGVSDPIADPLPLPGPAAVAGERLLRFDKDANPVQRLPPDPATLTGYQWPLKVIRITQPFGPARGGSRIVTGQPFHDGLDMATFCGDRIYAAHDGVVLAAGRKYDDAMGWIGDLTPYYTRLDAEHLWTTLPIVIVVDDGNGYRSVYAHLSKVGVTVGQAVKAGTFLGWEGATGRASGCHLHYGLFSPDEPATMAIDPEVVSHMLVPAFEVARIDPLRVLPPRP
jgi:murein DD-endopeptidase MepM/ murein hydrolase activator NlpD